VAIFSFCIASSPHRLNSVQESLLFLELQINRADSACLSSLYGAPGDKFTAAARVTLGYVQGSSQWLSTFVSRGGVVNPHCVLLGRRYLLEHGERNMVPVLQTAEDRK
jgi:hypothetical protein